MHRRRPHVAPPICGSVTHQQEQAVRALERAQARPRMSREGNSPGWGPARELRRSHTSGPAHMWQRRCHIWASITRSARTHAIMDRRRRVRYRERTPGQHWSPGTPGRPRWPATICGIGQTDSLAQGSTTAEQSRRENTRAWNCRGEGRWSRAEQSRAERETETEKSRAKQRGAEMGEQMRAESREKSRANVKKRAQHRRTERRRAESTLVSTC
jgi:hypothetical protein